MSRNMNDIVLDTYLQLNKINIQYLDLSPENSNPGPTPGERVWRGILFRSYCCNNKIWITWVSYLFQGRQVDTTDDTTSSNMKVLKTLFRVSSLRTPDVRASQDACFHKKPVSGVRI
ncbi:hypothetical protein M8J77_009234 [Diaphorina citri]|nr:hypothetical protein M8J77_009234 [Diaphorina citri]